MKTILGKNKRDDSEKITIKTFTKPLLFLTPFLIGVIIFTIYPFFNVLFISFKENYKVLTHEYSSIGFTNYSIVLSDPTFISALKNTSFYALAVVPISLVLSIIIACFLNSKIKFKGLFQTVYFLPMVTSVTAVGLAWKWLFNFDYGIINYLISLFGAKGINWLNDPRYALTSLIIYGIWSMIPFTVILILSGLQNINTQYYTAAKVDGAKPMDIFFRITLPLLAPTIGLVTIINTISASKVFQELFPLFSGQPGPAYSLYTVIYYIYDTFYVKWKLGLAAASAMILFIIVLIFTSIQLYIQRNWKNY